jgi:hypothetical protein
MKLIQAKKFEKIIKLKMNKWTDEDWRYFDRYCETGSVPEWTKKK